MGLAEKRLVETNQMIVDKLKKYVTELECDKKFKAQETNLQDIFVSHSKLDKT